MTNGIKQMENVYYFDSSLWIKISCRNDYKITEDNLDDVLIWNIQYGELPNR